ncbi:MAG TPA: hypothetical protein VGT78_01165 [Rhizomicrobium sp.]|nr:hypothetical protein [Rhizomicrobium sp.]
MSLAYILGVLAGGLSLVSSALYARSIFLGTTKPNRVTWWIVTLVSACIVASYWDVGARETLYLPIAYTISFLGIALISLWYGDGSPKLGPLDGVCLLGALTSASIWAFSSSPGLALGMAIGTEFIGLIPTIYKSYGRPASEDRSAWLLATFASFLNVLALTSWRPALSAYPIYVFTTNFFVLTLLFWPRRSDRDGDRTLHLPNFRQGVEP